MKTPVHDFTHSYALAKGDADLHHQLSICFNTSALSLPDKTPLVATTVDIMTYVIQQARSMYAAQPDRLVAAISASSQKNALAVWSGSGRDWIIFSEGLMGLLRDQMGSVEKRFLDMFPELLNTRLMQRLLAQTPLSGGFKTPLSSFLYFSAVVFLTGHEAGHHLAGHESQYPRRAHAEDLEGDSIDVNGDRIVAQALERDADLIGLRLCRMAVSHLLCKLWEVEEAEALSPDELRDFQRVLAALISTGALSVAVFIKPRTISWEGQFKALHPPAVARILTLALSISLAIKVNFAHLDTFYRRWIRVMALEVAVGASIVPGSDAERVEQERIARGGEPAAIRATGIRKALHDPTFRKYMTRLEVTIKEIRPRLNPRM